MALSFLSLSRARVVVVYREETGKRKERRGRGEGEEKSWSSRNADALNKCPCCKVDRPPFSLGRIALFRAEFRIWPCRRSHGRDSEIFPSFPSSLLVYSLLGSLNSRFDPNRDRRSVSAPSAIPLKFIHVFTHVFHHRPNESVTLLRSEKKD